ERHEEALAQADRHAAPVDDAQIDGVPARGGGAQRADQAEVELRVLRVEPVERLEAVDRFEDEVAPAVGRQLAHFDAGEGWAPRTVAELMPRSGTPSGGSAAAAGSRPLELSPASAPSAHTMARRSPPTPHMCG